ncbi:MAG: hypothetical protein HUJ31_06990, partial [Pseudomonadales bacterium]|nr:hypothetical protein [Pseudomonadales bacterium]
MAPENLDWLEACERPAEPSLAAFYADSLCGQVRVAEDPANPDGRQISLAVMVRPALSAESRPDPVVFLAGGPGQAAREVGPIVFERFDELRVDHDLVLVDQRGTGDSNGLDCGITSAFLDELGSAPVAIAEAQEAMMRAC